MGLDTPFDKADYALFYACSRITMGNRLRVNFWEAPWFNGMSPREIIPSIYDISRRKSKSVHKALQDNAWIQDIDIHATLMVKHLREFITLWENMRGVVVNPVAHELHRGYNLQGSMGWLP